MQFGSNPDLVAEVVMAARQAARQRPLWVKLMPLVTDIGLIAKAAESSGADALTVANAYPAMAIDFRTGKSKLGNLTGGLSGPAIKPITLRLVWEAQEAVKIPVVGLGGGPRRPKTCSIISAWGRRPYRSERPVLLTRGPVRLSSAVWVL
jgi:dihydroorotate dehydrogenase (NAD+) catalytic subunit